MRQAIILAVIAVLGVAGLIGLFTLARQHEDKQTIEQVAGTPQPVEASDAKPATITRSTHLKAEPSDISLFEVRAAQKKLEDAEGAYSSSRSRSEELSEKVRLFAISVSREFYYRLKRAGIQLDDARKLAGSTENGYGSISIVSNEDGGGFVIVDRCIIIVCYKQGLMNVRGLGSFGLGVSFDPPPIDDGKEPAESCKSDTLTTTCYCKFYAGMSDISVPCGEISSRDVSKLRERLMEAVLKKGLTETLANNTRQ